MMRIYLVVMLTLVSAASLAGNEYYGDRERGWFWYEEPPVEVEEPKEDKTPEPVAAAPVMPAPMAPREILKKQGEDWEDAMAMAILDPTQENIEEYLAKTTQIQQQAQTFSTEFKRTIWTTPEYDYSLVRPTSPEAVMAANQQKQEDYSRQLMDIANKKGLIFYFRSDCPYCHKFAPLLKRFGESYGFTIIPVTLDGGGLPEYPYPKANGVLGHQLQVSSVPALFMVDPAQNKVAPVGYGYRDWTKLTSQILYANSKMDGTTELAGAAR